MTTLTRFARTLQDEFGNLVPVATVEVRQMVSGYPLAPIYSDRAAATPKTNPFTTSVADKGLVSFYAGGGPYRIVATDPAGNTVTWDNVPLGNLQETDAEALILGNTQLADVASGTIKGRLSAGPGDPEDLTLAQVATALAISRLIASFTPLANQPPAANFATIDQRNSHAVLAFDAAVQESAIFVGALPVSYAGGALKLNILAAMLSATSGTVGWDAAFDANPPGSSITADSYATAKATALVAVPATAGLLFLQTLTFANSEIDGLAAGNAFWLRIRRLVTGTATGDAQMILAWLETT